MRRLNAANARPPHEVLVVAMLQAASLAPRRRVPHWPRARRHTHIGPDTSRALAGPPHHDPSRGRRSKLARTRSHLVAPRRAPIQPPYRQPDMPPPLAHTHRQSCRSGGERGLGRGRGRDAPIDSRPRNVRPLRLPPLDTLLARGGAVAADGRVRLPARRPARELDLALFLRGVLLLLRAAAQVAA